MDEHTHQHREGWRFPPERRHVLQDEERRRKTPPEPLVQALGITSGDTVVDVGAGTGFWTLPLAQLVGSAGRVFAVDVEPIMLDEIRAVVDALGVENVETVQSEELHIPLPDHGADAAVLGFVLHEPADPPAFLGEIARLLKPGGRILVVDWHKRPTEMGPPVEHRLSAEESGAMLEHAGCAVERLSTPSPDAYALLGRVS